MRVSQPFATRDYSDLRRRLKSGVVRVLARAAAPWSIDVELQHFYSPIPKRGDLSADFWKSRSELVGIGWDLDAQLSYLRAELMPHLDEFDPPPESSGRPGEYFVRNGLFQGVDADILYAMIRRHRPQEVIELGAGFSTLVAAQACNDNRSDGHITRLRSFDPYADSSVKLEGLWELSATAAQDVPLETFQQLWSGDILFIDTSHTVKIGGDTVHLLLEVLPRLRRGVIVHFHDIFLPWHYPQEWIEHNRWYWTEQYMLQAFLACNPEWEILVANYALARAFPDELARLIPRYESLVPPLSMWIRKRPAALTR